MPPVRIVLSAARCLAAALILAATLRRFPLQARTTAALLCLIAGVVALHSTTIALQGPWLISIFTAAASCSAAYHWRGAGKVRRHPLDHDPHHPHQ